MFLCLRVCAYVCVFLCVRACVCVCVVIFIHAFAYVCVRVCRHSRIHKSEIYATIVINRMGVFINVTNIIYKL